VRRLMWLVSFLFLPCSALAATKPAAAPRPLAVRDTTRLGIPWTRWTTIDRFGRTITFYLSDLPDSLRGQTRPLALAIEGSGAQSVWMRLGEHIGGSLQNLTRRAAHHRVRVLIVEKPGVEFLSRPQQVGSAIGSSEEFRREHTLERWAEANAAALRAVLAMPDIAAGPVVVLGHSEGADVACRVAAIEPRVTHVASLSGSGASQLFDLLYVAGQPRDGDAPGDAEARRQQVLKDWSDVLADPLSTEKFWLGHAYNRWSSFLASNRLDDLLRTRAQVFLAHGTADTSVPVTSSDWLFAELRARGRDVRYQRMEGADHGLQLPGDPTDAANAGGLERTIGGVLDWALATPAAQK
jgi:pimeloyl-ACP methyl ester carboxylesterase